MASTQRIYNLIKLRATVSGNTWFNCHQFIYISRLYGFTEAAAPHTLPALWTDVPGAGAPDPATHDEWLNFTKGHGSSRIPYPTLALDTDAWCQFPCVGTGSRLQSLWHASDFPTELQSRQPLAMNREPSVPRYPPQIIQSRRSCTVWCIRLHPPFPSTNQPPDTHESHSPVEGNTQYMEKFRLCLTL